MHAFKTFLVVSAICAVASVSNVRAADTPEQARLREALRKTQEESSEPQTSKPASVEQPASAAQPAPRVKPAPVAAPATQAQKPAPAPKPVVAVEPKSSASDEIYSPVPAANKEMPALRSVLREESSELEPPPKKSTEEPKAKPETDFAVAPQSDKTPTAATPVENQPVKPQQEVKARRGKKAAAVEPPPLPENATKEQRLAELLRKYKADEMTPVEYHKQRAAILAEP